MISVLYVYNEKQMVDQIVEVNWMDLQRFIIYTKVGIFLTVNKLFNTGLFKQYFDHTKLRKDLK